jgi:hypothetical protein
MEDFDIEEGRKLLLEALAVPTVAPPEADTQEAKAQRAAVAELDNWDEPHFRKFKATLERHHPDVAEYVFTNLTASRGPQAVMGVATLLARIDALDSGSDPSRKATATADKKAVELLATRGLTDHERKRLADLVQVALGPTSPLASLPPDELAKTRRQKLLALKHWHNEWSAVAHADIKKRAYLIRLGLAERRSRAKDGEKHEPAPPAVL